MSKSLNLRSEYVAVSSLEKTQDKPEPNNLDDTAPFLPGYNQHEARWRGHFLNCFGSCTNSDLTAFCFFWVPFVAFGCNSQRALRIAWWKDAIIFFLLGTGAWIVYQIATFKKRRECAALYVEFRRSAEESLMKYGSHAEYTQQKYLFMQAENCTMELESTVMWFGLLWMVCAIILTIFASIRRKQIRERFGMEGEYFEDCCTWFWCPACALCQETRTLMHNRVDNGVWRGPAVEARNINMTAASRPPAVAVMV